MARRSARYSQRNSFENRLRRITMKAKLIMSIQTKKQTSARKKTILLLSLLLAASPAWAEWLEITETTDGTVHYIDTDTIRKEGNFRKVWLVQNLKVRDEYGGLSHRMKVEYDCANERYRALAASIHSGPMATGKTLREGSGISSWKEIPPKTAPEVKLKFVCGQ